MIPASIAVVIPRHLSGLSQQFCVWVTKHDVCWYITSTFLFPVSNYPKSKIPEGTTPPGAYGNGTVTRQINHDEIGNRLSDVVRTYTWRNGRELATVTRNGVTWTNTYNANGMRTKRTDGTNTYEYIYNGDKLMQMKKNGEVINFTYIGNTPATMTYQGNTFYYVVNAQGDVTGMTNSAGKLVISYTYDAWGRWIYYIQDAEWSNVLGGINPLLYRGYVYDHETGLYYLQSRYYDPSTHRFLNADVFTSTGQGLLGNNMFAYCLNNPVNFEDPTGELTQGQIHDLVLEDIILKKKVEGRNTLSDSMTCIYYNCVDFRGGWGFCDLYDTDTGEVWELKKDSFSYTCTTAYASHQLDRYVLGRLKHKISMKLVRGGTLLVGKTAFSVTDSSGTYNIVYWEEGNGILRYSYSFNKSKSQQANEAMLLLMCSTVISPSKSGGCASVISFSEDRTNAA